MDETRTFRIYNRNDNILYVWISEYHGNDGHNNELYYYDPRVIEKNNSDDYIKVRNKWYSIVFSFSDVESNNENDKKYGIYKSLNENILIEFFSFDNIVVDNKTYNLKPIN